MSAVRYRQNPAVRVREIDGDIFLVEPESEEVFYLDAVTSGLWRLLAAPATLADLEATFAAAFPDRPRATVAADVAAALADLVARKLALSAP